MSLAVVRRRSATKRLATLRRDKMIQAARHETDALLAKLGSERPLLMEQLSLEARINKCQRDPDVLDMMPNEKRVEFMANREDLRLVLADEHVLYRGESRMSQQRRALSRSQWRYILLRCDFAPTVTCVVKTCPDEPVFVLRGQPECWCCREHVPKSSQL
jgi:hypothetical protein